MCNAKYPGLPRLPILFYSAPPNQHSATPKSEKKGEAPRKMGMAPERAKIFSATLLKILCTFSLYDNRHHFHRRSLFETTII